MQTKLPQSDTLQDGLFFYRAMIYKRLDHTQLCDRVRGQLGLTPSRGEGGGLHVEGRGGGAVGDLPEGEGGGEGEGKRGGRRSAEGKGEWGGKGRARGEEGGRRGRDRGEEGVGRG